MKESGQHKPSKTPAHQIKQPKSILGQLKSICALDDRCGSKSHMPATNKSMLQAQKGNALCHKAPSSLIQELDCREVGAESRKPLQTNRSLTSNDRCNVAGGDGMIWEMDTVEGNLLLKVHLPTLGSVSARDVDVETIDDGRGLVIKLSGCTDLHVATPGFAYKAAYAQRKRLKSLLIVTVPTDK